MIVSLLAGLLGIFLEKIQLIAFKSFHIGVEGLGEFLATLYFFFLFALFLKCFTLAFLFSLPFIFESFLKLSLFLLLV